MPPPDRSDERRRKLIPIVARAFAELGYRRTTTAILARRCRAQPTVLYRLWPDKRAMFIAAIEYVYDLSAQMWERLLASADGKHTAAQRLLEYEATHHGEFGLYRIVFAGLSECDDPAIRAALQRMYGRYQAFIVRRLVEHRGVRTQGAAEELAAWALIGMGTISSIGRELELLPAGGRRRLWERIGALLIDRPAP